MRRGVGMRRGVSMRGKYDTYSSVSQLGERLFRLLRLLELNDGRDAGRRQHHLTQRAKRLEHLLQLVSARL